jgi:hypothetical protein
MQIGVALMFNTQWFLDVDALCYSKDPRIIRTEGLTLLTGVQALISRTVFEFHPDVLKRPRAQQWSMEVLDQRGMLRASGDSRELVSDLIVQYWARRRELCLNDLGLASNLKKITIQKIRYCDCGSLKVCGQGGPHADWCSTRC